MPAAGDDDSLDLESCTSKGTVSARPLVPALVSKGSRHHRNLEIKRLDTIRSFQAPPRVRPEVRLPGDFRTLSIHVTETRGAAPALRPPHKHKEVAADIDDLARLDWHLLDPDEVCQRLSVAPSRGLDNEAVARRLARDGKNTITPPRTNWPKKIFFYFFGGFGSLLFCASVLCFVAWRPLGEPNPAVANLALAVVLLIVVVLQAVFNAYQDWTTTRTMSSIASVLPTTVVVRRDGLLHNLSASDVVKGDVVLVKMGDKIPADLRLIETSPDLQLDRSILTGESIPVGGCVDKTDDNFMETRNIALQGTLCTEGTGVGIVVGCGDLTVFGRIAKAAGRSRPVRSTLEVEITRFVWIIASLAAVVVIFIIILWAAWLCRDHPDFIPVPVLIVSCVSVAVAFIPEGLPFAITMSLTVIAHKMKRQGVLCKALTTVESLGSVSVLASDKTGTLTQNRMSVVNVTVGTTLFTADDARRASINAAAVAHEALSQIVSIAAICNDASFAADEGGQAIEARKVNGDATDAGLLRFADSVTPVSTIRRAVCVTRKLAFNSKNKYAVKVVRPSRGETVLPGLLSDEADQILLVKGAPDVLMHRCTRILDIDGTERRFSPASAATLSAVQCQLASFGQRVLLLAKRPLQQHALADLIGTEEDQLVPLVHDLTIIGLVALVDPPKHDTRDTVERCRRAGIRFFTGDFAGTAAAIARQVGIITATGHKVHSAADLSVSSESEKAEPVEPVERPPGRKAIVLSGSELQQLTEKQWSAVIKYDELVFARTTPQQKLQIVKRFQAAGETVAVTGDGVNDSGALKQADVGVAVAGGSEVAMEAADLVLLDDFSAIVTAVESGRLCFENLRKSILYLLPAGSFSELIPVLLNVLFGLPQALSSIQMILICAVTDVLPALALIFEKPEADLLLRPPRDRKKDRLADWRLLLHAYGFLGLLESLTACVGAFYFALERKGISFSALWLKYGNYDVDANVLAEAISTAQSVYFFNLIVVQWFNLLATRTRRRSIFQQDPLFNPRTRNLVIFPAMALALLLGLFFSYPPFFQRILSTRSIDIELFFLPLGYGVALLALDEARKAANRRWPAGLLARCAW
ncbi:cation-translocating P-type ATPase [Rhodotorula paludigena]|uniref:cation-translocating P-type ATPase n=1 Tax=Rhodotorula paludigena TaxID=86838 RepID=UPI00317EA60F